MFLKIFLCCLAASLTLADNTIDSTVIPPEVRVESSVSFETAHKRPESLGDDGFQTSHKINNYDMESMNLLPTKEKPELNPILSALINEDVMKSIEAKRAIEKAELEIIKAEVDAAVKAEEKKIEKEKKEAKEKEEKSTEAPLNVLTTVVPIKKGDLEKDDDINVGFVDQAIALDTAGTENNKKSRIEIKKGPNGQDYEYEYVYYYEDEEDDAKPKGAVAEDGEEAETRGKSRYTNIERSTPASPADNSLVSGKAKGRSSNVDESIEAERLPHNTRFPSRSKAVDVPPTPALDSVDSAAEKKKISVKRPSLELVDSETFNTDEKLSKSSRNSDDTKSAITIEQETAALASAQAAAAAAKTVEAAEAAESKDKDTSVDPDEDIAQTTPAMEKAALDLYALLTNENNNMDMTTDSSMDVTTIVPNTTDGDDLLTTVVEEEPSSTTTTTTTTTTPEPTTTTTTTTTSAPSLYGGRRTGAAGGTSGRNRFKLKSGNSPTTTTTTEAPSEAPKTGKNRFSRPSIGGRARPGAKTTAAPASEEPQHEEEIAVKEAKPVSSGFSRNRPRNRFNLRGSTTTTEASAHDSNDQEHEEGVSSTTARSLRARPTLNIRGRSRTTTTKSPANEEETVNDSDNSVDDKPQTPAPSHSGAVRPSRFNLNRAAGGRLPGRAKLGRPSTETPAAAENEDSAADSSHHNDVKGSEGEEAAAEKPAEEPASVNAGGLNRLKNRPRLGVLQKTELKPKVAPAPLAPRKVNPLLANRRLKVGPSTTEAAPVEETPADTAAEQSSEAKEETSDAANEEAKDETTEETETTTKQQARGLGLLGQRRRLPLRKPGTLL